MIKELRTNRNSLGKHCTTAGQTLSFTATHGFSKDADHFQKYLEHGSAKFFFKGQVVNISGFATLPLYTKATIDHLFVNGHGCVLKHFIYKNR